MVTPQTLSKRPLAIVLPELSYDVYTQSNFGKSTPKEIRLMGTTYNATQTFNPNGTPRDRDND